VKRGGFDHMTDQARTHERGSVPRR
jgi:hypothetical protein